MSDPHAMAPVAFEAARKLVDRARIPGAVLGIVDSNGKRTVRHAGYAQLLPSKRTLQTDTWFDLASLTKVLFTTPGILQLHIDGIIDLDEPLTRLLPDLCQYHTNGWQRRTTFRQCLGHQTHFPAVEPIYTYGTNPELLRAFVLQRQWQHVEPVYSDINFILLGIALERQHGCRLHALDPGPGFAFSAAPETSAATEHCTWRNQMICGEVHDENCYALQGSGHAGLFGTATSVLDYAEALLTGSAHAPDLIDLMRSPLSATRAHGWERAHSGWSGGDKCSSDTLGHTGFTGTGLWIDFAAGHAWTLLSNRVHPTRHCDSGIDQLRRSVGATLYAA